MDTPAEAITLHSLLIASGMVFGFIAVLFVATWLLPGRIHKGFPTKSGEQRTYKLNGLLLFIFTHAGVLFASALFGFSLRPLVTYFWSLLVVSNVVAVLWTVVLFFQGRKNQPPEHRASTPGAVIKELWMGNELNPEWLGVDLKIFAYQPSLLGLGLLNLAFAYQQWEDYGVLTNQMYLYQFFWWAYLFTHYFYEANVLSMWDIIAEKFGFMLVWGDLVLVPFFYCIGGWALLSNRTPISPTFATTLALVFLLGLWIFRGSNAQKYQFKLDPYAKIWGQKPETIGGKLLVSGWWGIGRKINYTGEIMVYSSIVLTTGFKDWTPYLLPIWLCSLLVHRAWRDEQRCKEKYGELWDEYCKRVTFRMIPFLY